MAFASATKAQQQSVRDKAINATKAIELATDTGPVLALGPAVDTAASALVAALAAAGTGSGGSTAIVADAGTVPVQNSAGTSAGNGTVTVANGAVTAVKLAATRAVVASAGNVSVPITFTTARTAGQTATVQATFTVANGVITAITIA